MHESVSKGKIDVCLALLQHGANVELRNSENKTALDLADANTKPILTGEYRKDELLEASRLGDEQRLLELLNPLNVNCHASDGRRSTPLHLASGYNRIRVVQILLQNGADVHAKDKGGELTIIITNPKTFSVKFLPLRRTCSIAQQLQLRPFGGISIIDQSRSQCECFG